MGITQDNDEPKPDTEDRLRRQVVDWLNSEGYPTEYKVANLFRRHRFHVMQGGYVLSKDQADKETKREIDVVASITFKPSDDLFLRVSHVVECKWAMKKPWVVFTSPSSRMAPSACVAQSIASDFGDALLWTMAGLPPLHEMTLFATPPIAGFGGRQALSDGQKDHFYSALKGVVDNSYSHVAAMDAVPRTPGRMPRGAEIVFPMVVIEGRLFRALFDPALNDMRLEEAQHIRCHWRGSMSAVSHATVDIVTLGGLEEVIEKRAAETETLLKLLHPVAEQIQRCANVGSLDGLEITNGPRGVLGLPKLLNEIRASGVNQRSEER